MPCSISYVGKLSLGIEYSNSYLSPERTVLDKDKVEENGIYKTFSQKVSLHNLKLYCLPLPQLSLWLQELK